MESAHEWPVVALHVCLSWPCAKELRRVLHRHSDDGYVKELHWMDHMETENTEWLSQDTAAYLRRFTGALTEDSRRALDARKAALVDFTPGYATSYAAPARAKAIMPHAKIVIILRVRPLFHEAVPRSVLHALSVPFRAACSALAQGCAGQRA